MFKNSFLSLLEPWTDAYLAAFAKMSAAGLSTFDQGFRRFSGLALELLA